MGKFWGDRKLEVGWGKVACWSTLHKSCNISETRKDNVSAWFFYAKWVLYDKNRNNSIIG